MELQKDRQLRELQIYTEIGQNIAIVESMDTDKKEVLRNFEEEILLVQPTICIDLNKVNNICDLTKNILEQCKRIILNYDSANIDIAKYRGWRTDTRAYALNITASAKCTLYLYRERKAIIK